DGGVADDRIQDGLPAVGAGHGPRELAAGRDAQADRGVSEDAGGAQERQARSQRLERPHERQQRHALSNPNDKMDPIRKRDLPTWAKSANAREHDLLAALPNSRERTACSGYRLEIACPCGVTFER